MSPRTLLRRLHVAGIALVASSVLLVGCADGTSGTGSGGGDTAATGIIGNQSDAGTPVDGGTLSFATNLQVATLDPSKVGNAGATGGSQLAAVYDLLVRYDSETDSYLPQLAESLTESPDRLSWTVTLRDGVRFSDGTPLDAAAVVASTNRFNTRKGNNSSLFLAGVDKVEATDASTVVYTLKEPWSEFPSMLAFGHGMIVASAADNGDKFTPIGAGPFTFEAMNPGSDLIVKANPDYWAGKPHLDKLKFVEIKDEQPKIDALKTGGIQMAYLRNMDTINVAKENFPGYFEYVSGSDLGIINNRAGHPGADPRIRKAMALAIDPKVIDQRARSGEGMPGADLFQSWSKWHSDTAPLTPAAAQAKTLLDQAKSDGYDGHLSYVTQQNTVSQDMALAAQAMLKDVGFSVDITYVANAADLMKAVMVDHSFDLAPYSAPMPDAAIYMRLFGGLNSSSTTNAPGYTDPRMDELLKSVKVAPSDEDRRAAIAVLQEEFNNKVPYLVWGASAAFVPWSDNVHGIVPSVDGIMLFGNAWIG